VHLEHFDPPSETGTDGVAPGKLDKALLGGEPQRVGRFAYNYGADSWTWSSAVARMHGYEPGELRPTTDLVLRHKHPDDLAKVKALLKRSAAPFSSRHRIRTRSGEERSVVVVGEIVKDEHGEVAATRGFYIDITEALHDDIQRAVTEELDEIVAHRALIEQAKGMLMVVYDLAPDVAFAVLRWRSQELNIKLHDVAGELVAHLPSLLNVPGRARGAVDHFLMTLDKPE
jgi:PAS domain S-box-containing protein